MSVRSLPLRKLGALALTAALAACAGGAADDDVVDTDPASTGPVYGVISVPPATDGTNAAYVILGDSLTGTFDPADAVLELEGRPLAATLPGSDLVYITSGSAPELTRYRYVDGALVEDGTISFAGQQVTAFAGYASQLQIVDEDTAYWFDRSGRIVVWNPSDFTVDGSILVPEMVREDAANPGTNFSASLTGAPLWHGTDLVSFVAWDSRVANNITVPRASGVLIVDTTRDTAELFVDEVGCGYGRDGVIDGEWLYVATEAVGTSVRHLDEANGPAPCLRRFNLRTRTFDDWSAHLGEAAGGPVGSLAVTADGVALIHVLDVDAADPLVADGTISNPRVLSSADLWKTARLTLGDAPSVEVLDVPLRSASVLPVTLLDGLRVTPTFGDAPQILEVTADGFVPTGRADADVTGFTSAVFQIR